MHPFQTSFRGIYKQSLSFCIVRIVTRSEKSKSRFWIPVRFVTFAYAQNTPGKCINSSRPLSYGLNYWTCIWKNICYSQKTAIFTRKKWIILLVQNKLISCKQIQQLICIVIYAKRLQIFWKYCGSDFFFSLYSTHLNEQVNRNDSSLCRVPDIFQLIGEIDAVFIVLNQNLRRRSTRKKQLYVLCEMFYKKKSYMKRKKGFHFLIRRSKIYKNYLKQPKEFLQPIPVSYVYLKTHVYEDHYRVWRR